MRWVKSLLYLLVLLVLFSSGIQKAFNIFKTKGLEGYFEPSQKPVFTMASFKTGEYQGKMTPHLDRTIGFHEVLTRVFNQCDFSFFSITHAERVIKGKGNNLQATAHISEFLGLDYLGKIYMDDKVARLKYLQEYVLRKKGIHLLVIFAPGKGFYYPESIPDRYLKNKKNKTNYDYYVTRLQEEGIPLIDFNKWLVSLKDTSHHNLYPKTGIHWSCYGAWLCADSLIRYLEVTLDRKLPRMVLDSLVVEPWARKEDDDMDRVLNLIWRIPVPPMTYPVFHHTYDSASPKPSALFISDSFYWYWHYNGIIKNTFRREDMWYYDKEVYPDQNTRPTNTAQISLDSALNRQEVLILMTTNGGYGNLGFGFIDRAYEYYYPYETPVKRLEATFRKNLPAMEQIKEKAKAQNFPVDAVLRNEAIYMYNSTLEKISKYKEK